VVAEIAGEYLRKVFAVLYRGQVANPRVGRKIGVKRYTTEIVVDMQGTTAAWRSSDNAPAVTEPSATFTAGASH
jgi:single-stranded DNA-binding protein